MHIEIKTMQLSQSVCFDLFLENSKVRISTIMSSFFLCCKTKTVILQARKKKRTIIYCLLRNEYIAKNEHTFYETFFSLWIGNWCKQRDEKKLKCSMSKKNYCFH